MLTYVHVCSRMLTYAHVSSRMQAHTHLPLLLQELRRHYRVDGLTEAVLSQVQLTYFLFFSQAVLCCRR